MAKHDKLKKIGYFALSMTIIFGLLLAVPHLLAKQSNGEPQAVSTVTQKVQQPTAPAEGVAQSTNALMNSAPTSTAPTSTVQTSPNASFKPYTAPFCTTVTLPYKTVYKNVTYLSVGQSNESGGIDGYTKTCTPDSTGYKPPDITYLGMDKTVYIGIQETGPTARDSADQRQAEVNLCIQQLQALSPNSNAYMQCLSMH
ncbi:MAG: hypothetical protein JWM81_905 [Candidatus Saccharibacteria bacterium]|nr:hypothetical protein [Candidatus Saccharibacteria bacterium]